MNPADKMFYLTLTRSFSGDENGFDLARDADRVFYDNADIRLEGWMGEFKIQETQFKPAERTKIPGIFPEVPGYCYESANLPYRFTSYRLIIHLPGMSTPVFSRIPEISEPVIPSRFDHEIALYPNGYKPEIQFGQGIKYCQMLCEFHYQEYNGNWVDRSVTFSIRKNIMNIGGGIIYPDLFFNLIRKNISPINDTIARKFISADLIFLCGDQYYKDYIDTYENSGNLDLPQKGNINNGYGLFTMIWSVKKENMTLDPQTHDSLWNGEITRKLGFVRW